jgi:sec-independent protein translocase protein TatA
MTSLAFLGDIGASELLVIFLAILVLFGSKRLPEMARSIGRALEELRRASQDFRDQIMHADEMSPPPPTALPPPAPSVIEAQPEANVPEVAPPDTSEPKAEPGKEEKPPRELAG